MRERRLVLVASGASDPFDRPMLWVSAAAGSPTSALILLRRGIDQVVAPRPGVELFPIGEMESRLEFLAIGGRHRRLPSHMDDSAAGAREHAGDKWQGDGQQQEAHRRPS